MGTPFLEINKGFLRKIHSYSFNDLDDENITESCRGIMDSALVKIKTFEHDLSKRTDHNFEADLSSTEMEVLTSQMVVEWVDYSINDEKLLHMFYGTKDERFGSQALHTKALLDLSNFNRAKVNQMTRDYSYKPFIKEKSGD